MQGQFIRLFSFVSISYITFSLNRDFNQTSINAEIFWFNRLCYDNYLFCRTCETKAIILLVICKSVSICLIITNYLRPSCYVTYIHRCNSCSGATLHIISLMSRWSDWLLVGKVFLVAKLLYKSKCPSVRMSVCQPRLGGNVILN